MTNTDQIGTPGSNGDGRTDGWGERGNLESPGMHAAQYLQTNCRQLVVGRCRETACCPDVQREGDPEPNKEGATSTIVNVQVADDSQR